VHKGKDRNSIHTKIFGDKYFGVQHKRYVVGFLLDSMGVSFYI
jgi:hypothetical protein